MKLKTIALIVVALVVAVVIFRRRAGASMPEPGQPPPASPPPQDLDRAKVLPPGTPVDMTGVPYEPPLRDKTPPGGTS